jgi:flavodoxin
MSIAVVYYSAQGNCALAAKALSEKLGAKLIELTESKQRKLNGIGFMTAGFQAMWKIKTKLQGKPWETASDCAELHIITPIWAGKQAPAINTFLSQYNFSGKKVSLYTVQADTKDSAKPARDALAEAIKTKGGTVAGSYGLFGSAPNKEPSAELAQRICELSK